MGKRSDESLYDLPEIDPPEKKAPVLSSVAQFDPRTAGLPTLLAEAHTLKEVEGRLKLVKELIKEAVLSKNTNGLRCGPLCAIVRFQAGKRTLDREMLVENGVTPAQIEASVKEGPGYWVCELPKIEG